MRLLAQQHAVRERDADPQQRQGGDRERPERALGAPAQRKAGEGERQPGHQRAEHGLAPAGQRHHRQRGNRQVAQEGRRSGAIGHRVQLRERQRAQYPERQRQRQIADHDQRDGDARGR